MLATEAILALICFNRHHLFFPQPCIFLLFLRHVDCCFASEQQCHSTLAPVPAHAVGALGVTSKRTHACFTVRTNRAQTAGRPVVRSKCYYSHQAAIQSYLCETWHRLAAVSHEQQHIWLNKSITVMNYSTAITVITKLFVSAVFTPTVNVYCLGGLSNATDVRLWGIIGTVWAVKQARERERDRERGGDGWKRKRLVWCFDRGEIMVSRLPKGIIVRKYVHKT